MARTKGGNAIPNNVNQFLGDTRLEKGRWGDGENSFFLLAWDFADECTGKECPVYEKCYYMQNWKSIPCEKTSKCALQQKYLKNVMKAVVEKMSKNKATEETVIKLGYHLIPLYAQLFKFKMWETHNQDIIVYSQGSPKVHPVYKEMREIIKAITGVWKDMSSVFKEKADPSKVGDSAFIDAMYSGSYSSSPDEDNEEPDPKGSGIDFDEEGDPDDNPDESSSSSSSNSSSESEHGDGLGASGFEVLEEGNKKKKSKRKQKNYHKKKPRKMAKARINVPTYNSRAHRSYLKEGEEPVRGEEVRDMALRKKAQKEARESKKRQENSQENSNDSQETSRKRRRKTND